MRTRWGILAIFWLLRQPAQAAIVFTSLLTPEQVVPLNGAPSPANVSHASAVATLTLNLDPAAPTLAYEIIFSGLSLENDIQGVHFHIGIPGAVPPPDQGDVGTRHSDSSVNGPHVLNVFGLPREDDADMFANFATNTITGVWDNNDFNYGLDGNRDPGDSIALAGALEELFIGHLYIQVHSLAYPVPDTGELRGQIYQVPEPNRFLLLGLSCVILATQGRRMRTPGYG